MPVTKFLLTIAFISLFSFSKAQEKTEGNLSLDGYWSFKIDPNNVGEKEGWNTINYQKEGWDMMPVPGNWDTRNEYSHYAGKAWYQKIVVVPQAWSGKKIHLNFDGVYFDSKVWLNGKLLGSNNNGFLPFEFNVTDIINKAGKNTIVVCADNTFRLGAVWNWGGIRRSVKLLAYNDAHITKQHITPTVDLSKGTANVEVKIYIENEGTAKKHLEGFVELAGQGLVKLSIPFNTDVAAHNSKTVTLSAAIDKKNLHLWHFDDPFLYSCTTTINEGNETLHRLNDRFGLRKIEVDNKNYTFKINGEPVRLMGFNLVPDDRTTGNTLPLWRVKADIDDMKALGCNMARLTHFPLPKEMYDYMDERGILVFPEVSLWGATQTVDPDSQIPKDWLKRMIDNNYNHPCVIGWSVGNEIGHNPLALKYVKSAIEHSKSLDPTHLAVVVTHTADGAVDIIDYADMGLVNKYSANLGPVTRKMHTLHPDKLLFYSEYGNSQNSEDPDTDLNAKLLLDSIRNLPYLMGASLWTYNDYRSNYLNTKSFSETRPWGIVNDFRQKKKSWYSFQKEYSPLKACKIESVKLGASNSTALLTLTPRNKLDLPAYAIKNYRVVWRIKNDKGQILSADFMTLPLISPGDNEMKQQISWPQSKNAATMELELVSSLNYTIADTTIYFVKPKAPNIIYHTGARTLLNDYRAKTGSIRVVFEKNDLAQGYKIKYGKDKLVSETPVTTNSFIDIKGLNFNEEYNFTIVSINSFGESEPSAIQRAFTQYAPAPPIIKYTEPADKGFFIGYETLEDDYMFEVRYSPIRGNYNNAKLIKATTKGALFVPNLINGQTYYMQMRRLKQNTYASLWSEEVAIKPDGGQLAEAPVINGAVQKGDQAIIFFTPVQKAIGYTLKYQIAGSNAWKEASITAAQISQYQLSGLNAAKKYEFKLAAINSAGLSGFSSVK